MGMLISVLGPSVIALNLGGDMPLAGFVCILVAAIGWSFGNIASKQASYYKRRSKDQTCSIISSNTGKNKASALSALALVVWGGLVACSDFNSIFSHI